MAKNTTYRIKLSTTKDHIICEVEKAKFNKKERDILEENNFTVQADYPNYAIAVNNSENITKAISLPFNKIIATEELLDMYRAIRGDANKPHYKHDLSSWHPGNNQKEI